MIQPPLRGTSSLALLVSMTLFTGCASIVDGSNQPISISTPGCHGASCEATNDKGKWYVKDTPGSVTVRRSFNDLVVECKKASFTSKTNIPSKTKGMAFGNILFGGIIGAGVDASTGAAYDYPSEVILPMQCSDPGGSETDSAHSSGNATVAAANAQGNTFGEQPSGAGSAISASVASSSLTSNQSASNPGAATQAATATSFKLGLKAMEVPVSTDQTGQIRQAVTVTSVDRGGSADNASLKVNDVLISINGEPIRNLEHLKMLLGKHSTSQQIYITVMRDTSFFSTYVKAAESQL